MFQGIPKITILEPFTLWFRFSDAPLWLPASQTDRDEAAFLVSNSHYHYA